MVWKQTRMSRAINVMGVCVGSENLGQSKLVSPSHAIPPCQVLLRCQGMKFAFDYLQV